MLTCNTHPSNPSCVQDRKRCAGFKQERAATRYDRMPSTHMGATLSSWGMVCATGAADIGIAGRDLLPLCCFNGHSGCCSRRPAASALWQPGTRCQAAGNVLRLPCTRQRCIDKWAPHCMGVKGSSMQPSSASGTFCEQQAYNLMRADSMFLGSRTSGTF
jgi:hypothetical protein